MTKKQLWNRISTYHFDHIVTAGLWTHLQTVFSGSHVASKAFAARIARKHNWHKDFALKAIWEYKKFVYLGVVSDFYVTPSKIIDVIWHEHLLFSKAYRDFCNDVIEYMFDHHPELIPMADQTGRFSAQYLDTLDLYKIEFGQDAPDDIWGTPKYDENKINPDIYLSRKKKTFDDAGTGTNNTHMEYGPLWTNYELSENNNGMNNEFNNFDGGEFGGAGADGQWGDSNDASSDGDGDGGGDGGGCSGGCGGGGD